jgi:hypothetical protein
MPLQKSRMIGIGVDAQNFHWARRAARLRVALNGDIRRFTPASPGFFQK